VAEQILRQRVVKVGDLEELEQQLSFVVLKVQMSLALVVESLGGHELHSRRFYHRSVTEE
jgi:hypothetical protein